MAQNPSQSVLVTGGAGYIGSHVVLALLEAGFAPVVLDDLSTGNRDVIPAGVPLCIRDVSDQAFVTKTISAHACDAVMHFAGSIIVPESVEQPLKYYRNNTAASRNLIECCVDAGIRAFVFSSTAAVYGDAQGQPVREDVPTAPTNPYGWSKLMTEQMLRDTSAAHGMRHAILRYFNVAGADPAGRSGQSGPNTSHLIRVACELACGRRDGMQIFGTDYDTPDGTCVRDFIHVSDLAAAHVLAVRRLLEHGQDMTLNCGYGHGFSVRQVLDVVTTMAGRELPIDIGPRRPGDVATLISDPTKIRELLGWTPAHDDLELIVETALAWEQKRGEA
jgi:UDP-glucose 4-epimerase